ncbi:hypothetical protein BDU57DRAFT_519487 [Ampelomyces quisqualis]|uniref:Uncharacterized protein n=1 Tax=Ampelomyces quisqualis TaxID=50730 RepID=A0A6A5QGH2_AMPQU|nr:hypothetical protein BDU57DRAFT_519487 [Ampelomyces quisqualis]
MPVLRLQYSFLQHSRKALPCSCSRTPNYTASSLTTIQNLASTLRSHTTLGIQNLRGGDGRFAKPMPHGPHRHVSLARSRSTFRLFAKLAGECTVWPVMAFNIPKVSCLTTGPHDTTTTGTAVSRAHDILCMHPRPADNWQSRVKLTSSPIAQ